MGALEAPQRGPDSAEWIPARGLNGFLAFYGRQINNLFGSRYFNDLNRLVKMLACK